MIKTECEAKCLFGSGNDEKIQKENKMSKERCSSCNASGAWETFILLAFVIALTISAIMITRYCATSITGDVPEITKALNDKGVAGYFQKGNISEFKRYGEESIFNSSHVAYLTINNNEITCYGDYLPYRYKIESKDGKLTYYGDDLISKNVPFSKIEDDMKSMLSCVVERNKEIAKKMQDRKSWE